LSAPWACLLTLAHVCSRRRSPVYVLLSAALAVAPSRGTPLPPPVSAARTVEPHSHQQATRPRGPPRPRREGDAGTVCSSAQRLPRPRIRSWTHLDAPCVHLTRLDAPHIRRTRLDAPRVHWPQLAAPWRVQMLCARACAGTRRACTRIGTCLGAVSKDSGPQRV
jgi:hypothetical protein